MRRPVRAAPVSHHQARIQGPEPVAHYPGCERLTEEARSPRGNARRPSCRPRPGGAAHIGWKTLVQQRRELRKHSFKGSRASHRRGRLVCVTP